MPALSFRLKLLLSMMLLVAAVTGATLLVTQRNVEATYRRIFEERFARESAFFSVLQETRLTPAKEKGRELSRSVRLIAVIEEGDPALLYKIALDELRNVVAPSALEPDRHVDVPPPSRSSGEARKAEFFRFVTAAGAIVPTDDPRAGLTGARAGARWETELARVGPALTPKTPQRVGYLAPLIEGHPTLHEVVVTRVADPVSGRMLAALAIGFSIDAQSDESLTDPRAIRSGIFFEGELHAPRLAPALRPAISRAISDDLARAAATPTDEEPPHGDLTMTVDGRPERVFYRALDPSSGFPPAYQVALFSMADAWERQRDLRRKVLAFGGMGLALGLLSSLAISHSLSVPLRELVAGTGEIQRGNLSVKVPVRSRDEVGRLAASFNEMAEGLALKEKYRSVLDLVIDKDVARELLEGCSTLGGEIRMVSVLFCDIRGFTPLTQDMEPADVITLLNEHMSGLTRVVHANHGVVDKFVGDSLMAIFGAPKTGAHDAWNAVKAAWELCEERRRLNLHARTAIEIGVGVATGEVVAGCMGSSNRLNYTVLGGRVNLAARLCAYAGRMEVLLDETTRDTLAETIDVEALPPITLKGISAPVAAYRLVDIAGRAAAS